MSKHIHADLMLQYALDAMETERPWERWEMVVTTGWKKFYHAFSFEPECEYRRRADAPPVPLYLLSPYWVITKETTNPQKPKPVDMSVLDVGVNK